MPQLRMRALELDPETLGLAAGPDLPKVFGGLVDMGYPNGVATLVVLADGTTSLYTSTGGGIIGAGQHEQVARASRSFLIGLEAHLDHLEDDMSTEVPGEGRVTIRALTFSGRRAAEAPEDDLGYGRHPLSPVFHLAHDVIAQMRMIEERGGT